MEKSLEHRQEYFLEIFTKVQKKYGKSTYRLAGEGWKYHWQTLITTLMSAQTRDEVTIPVAERLFVTYPTLQSLAKAQVSDVRNIISRLNYCNTKARHAVEAAEYLLTVHAGEVPQTIEELILIPGVGRKTANLVITECFAKPGICVDTHVHRISNVFGFVKTKNPTETELELQKVAPKKLWGKINRLFVLWGKAVPGQEKSRFLQDLEEPL